MHKIKKYNIGGGMYNSSPSQWANTLGLPSTLSTIQSSSNFFNNTLNNNVNSNNWMKNIGNVTNTNSAGWLKNFNNVGNTINSLTAIKDVGKVIGGGKGIGNLLGGLSSSTGVNSGAMIGIAGDIIGAGLETFGLNKMDSNNASGVTKGLDFASKLPLEMIPGVGLAIKGGIEALKLVENFAGKTAKKQGTADMGNITGYGIAEVNQSANTKFGFSDTVKGWFGKSKRDNTNAKSKENDKWNILKSIPGYNEAINTKAANNLSPYIYQKNQQQLYGGIGTGMISAKKGTKLSPAKLRNIVNKVELKKFKQGGTMNVIPEGAFHSRKNDLPEDIAEQVTKKGIPVVTEEEGGTLQQHAEIERNEIIFHKKATEVIEDLFDKYNKAETKEEKDKFAVECGKYIAKEILVNTDDRTGLINSID